VRRNLPSRLGDIYVPVVLVLGFVFALVGVLRGGAWLLAAFVGIVGLGLGLFWLQTSKVMRRMDKLISDPPDGPQGEPTEAMLAVDLFDEAIHDAHDVPLTNQVRLDRSEAERLLERLRMALPRGSSTLGALFDELDELIRNAKPIPLTEQIRLDRDEVYDILDRMRASFANESLRALAE
jgi:hypothetical protein